ncbi:glycosyltransferase family 4 protein [Burkholderia vietnamiensis]|jgi:glycosyltransferase involved in cell wall biosynthesis|nr:glycosyltransferase family 4 protein [Burkholderia vietnamiensis]HDR9228358.1 glycosyltransferase family 4 protein [Burkholderia vietnamiensis]HDR9356412.1 glycosyltransferase family 4 protein [Burkholderia vietnamiensis]
MSPLAGHKIAIVHDWLVTRGGAERVLEKIVEIFPHADMFTVVDHYSDADRQFIQGKGSQTTFIQKLPRSRSKYRSYLPLMPVAIEQLDLSGYDIVISSSHAVAKAVLVGPNQFHVSYVHSPMRYAWDLQNQYLREAKLNRGLRTVLARWMLHKVRMWDARTSVGVDAFVANSNFIARRICKSYRRHATVIYPPVDTDAFSLHLPKEPFYLTASRLVPYKKVPEIVDAFRQMPDKKLVVVGAGPDLPIVKSMSTPNIEILGYQPFSTLLSLMQRANAFIFNAEEDFGIVPVEAQACGTPVIAYGQGGVRESVRDGSEGAPTGVFYDGQDAASIVSAVGRFEADRTRFDPYACRENALRFSSETFKRRFEHFVIEGYESFRSEIGRR